VPYRVDLEDPPATAFDTLVDLGALDIETTRRGMAAIFPDGVPIADIARALGRADIAVSPAVGRDDDSVWTLGPRSVRVRTFMIVPAGTEPAPGALRMVDSPAFGTGLHPTTALCLEALEDLLDHTVPARMLDVGTGSGILALAALQRGVRRAVGLEIDRRALRAAAENARLNEMADRLSLVHGDIEAVSGGWPLIVANIRAAELIAMAPALARRVASKGRLVLSGIPRSVTPDVESAYRRLGMTQIGLEERGGWTAFVFHPSW
jgi:ribosomal protein L11 methyltransferase